MSDTMKVKITPSQFELGVTVVKGSSEALEELADWVEGAVEEDSFEELTQAQLDFAERKIRKSVKSLAYNLRNRQVSAKRKARAAKEPVWTLYARARPRPSRLLMPSRRWSRPTRPGATSMTSTPGWSVARTLTTPPTVPGTEKLLKMLTT